MAEEGIDAAIEEEVVGVERGGWTTSLVDEADIAWLRKLGRIPERVECRIPPLEEATPNPIGEERVVFLSHFTRGLGLPVSPFLRGFLSHYGLQIQHLGANAILALSVFVVLCEAYLGVRPSRELWEQLFNLRSQSAGGRMLSCGAACISVKPKGKFPALPNKESSKGWREYWFYVKSAAPAGEDGHAPDLVNLPAFSNTTPDQRPNWGRTKKPSVEIQAMMDRVLTMIHGEGLRVQDLILTFIDRRVLPLQWRPHKMCHMSGRFDPTRITTKLLSKLAIAYRANSVSELTLGEDWTWGKQAYSRESPPETVSSPASLLGWLLFFSVFH